MAILESSDFVTLADRLRQQIESALDLSSRLPEGCPAPLREAIRYSLLAPGKRLRPILVLLAAEACGAPTERAMPAACAVEMVHAYSLIHDDLPAMDDDDLRRGRPTCHKVYGEAVAILAGDALLALAFQVLAQGIEPPGAAAACCARLGEAAGPCWLVGGQADDIDPPGPEAGLPALESIHARKTGALIRAALAMGGLAVGATAEQLAALDRYGRALGVTFQITDDLLDVRGTEEAMGKRVGKDAQAGKLTFPVLLGLEASLRRAEQLTGEACQALEVFGPRAGGLEALARYVLERNR
jgi:geranylgeranyl diphosphate synthase type II